MATPVAQETASVPNATALAVLAIGNSLLADEAVGTRVLEELRERDGLDGVQLIDGGTLGFSLLGRVEGMPALIVVDAGNLDAVPGTVRSFEGSAMDAFLSATGRRNTVHEIGLLDLMVAARLRESLPARRALVCVQPAHIAWGMELTAPVAAAVPAAADEVLRIWRGWGI